MLKRKKMIKELAIMICIKVREDLKEEFFEERKKEKDDVLQRQTKKKNSKT